MLPGARILFSFRALCSDELSSLLGREDRQSANSSSSRFGGTRPQTALFSYFSLFGISFKQLNSLRDTKKKKEYAL